MAKHKELGAHCYDNNNFGRSGNETHLIKTYTSQITNQLALIHAIDTQISKKKNISGEDQTSSLLS